MQNYFSKKELECPCCGQCFMADGFMDALNGLRAEINEPFVITSGFRCVKHNETLRDASPTSKHLKGLAVDIQVTPRLAWLIAHKAWKYGFFGIGIKKGMIHIDRRAEPTKALFGY